MSKNKLFEALHLLFAKTPRMGGKDDSEDKICGDFAKRLIEATRFEGFPAIWCHIANEFDGKPNPRFGSKLKAMGKVSGMADYVFLWDGGNLCLEFKTKVGQLKNNQKAVRTWCKAKGVPYRVARSAEEGFAILAEHGLPDLRV